MTATLSALREHLVAAAPPLHYDGDVVHTNSRCPAHTHCPDRPRRPLLVPPADQFVDDWLGPDPRLRLCPSCTGDQDPWRRLLADVRDSLPEHQHAEAGHTLRSRTSLTPNWVRADPTGAHRCCMPAMTRLDPARYAVAQLVAAHTHTVLAARAATHGHPDRWLAVGADTLDWNTRKPGSALQPLGDFHPWATCYVNGAGLAIFHVPTHVADRATVMPDGAGTTVLNPEHVDAGAWPVARALLRTKLEETGRPFSREVAALRELPGILEVAHAATCT